MVELSFLAIVLILVHYVVQAKQKIKREAEEKNADKQFDQTFKIACKEFLEERGYLKVLALKKRQLTFKDNYGNWYVDDWVQEFERFVESKMTDFKEKWLSYLGYKAGDFNEMFSLTPSPKLGIALEKMYSIKFDMYLYSVIQAIIHQEIINEAICEVFTNCGWNAQVTKASGDQGVDVIAELNGVRVAVQCKLYSSPVGNKAVQEVFAAKIHYDCQIAIVVTNNSYTPSAKQLASTCGVELLHHDALTNWIETQA